MRYLLVLYLVGCSTSPTNGKHGEKRPLICHNGGTCQKGIAPDATASSGGYYCYCPSGYAGPQCQIKYQACPTQPGILPNATQCHNGSPCIRDIDHDGAVYYHCECDDSVTDYSTSAVRRACQHASTVFCTQQFNRNSLGQAAGAYCLHGGTCVHPITRKGSGHHHDGCHCPAGVWTGAHCEILQDESLASKYHYYEQDDDESIDANGMSYVRQQTTVRSAILAVCAIVVAVMLGGMGYLAYDTHRQNSYRRRRKREKAARIPKQISVGKQKKKKQKERQNFEPLEIDEDPEG